MKISIIKTTEKEIKRFGKKAWRESNIEHYGRPVRWIKKNLIFKATENRVIIGTIKAKYESGVVYVGELIVTKDKRRQGIGKKLMKKVEKEGKQLGAHKIFLFTGKKWDAGRFYRRLGFKKVANLPKHYLKHDFVIHSKMI